MKLSQRTCINCRQKKEKSFLYRITLQNNNLTADLNQKLPGRGAYLCNKDCIEKVHPGKFIKAFQTIDYKTQKPKPPNIEMLSWQDCKIQLLSNI